MNLIGYWLGSLSDDDFLAPQEVMFQLPVDLREPVAGYLDRGVHVEQYRGSSWCRFFCGLTHNGSSELSDGEWVWPDGLAHYVREHGVLLPETFIENALEGAPISQDTTFDAEVSDAFWRSWCRNKMNPEFRTQLRDERRIADLQVEADFAALVAKRESEIGRSEKVCAMARCASRALIGVAFCAKHLVEANGNGVESLRLTRYRALNILTRWSGQAR